MKKKTILFVDDEPNLLKGLGRMLYPLKKEWNMLFVESGAEALQLIEKGDIEVVVSDMRMPGMNGFELLKRVRDRFPGVVRVMLTGQPDKDLYCDVMTVCHYFLWKPSSFEEFDALFSRIRDKKANLAGKELEQLIGSIVSLPSLPDLYIQLTQLLTGKGADSRQVASLILQDMAMSSQILKLVNSAFFSLSREVFSIQEAVSYLGLDTLRNLVLVQYLFDQCTHAERREFHLDALWQHSFCVAATAKRIAAHCSDSQSIHNGAYLAGLLHDIGKLLLIRHRPEEYRAIQQIRTEQNLDQYSVEKEQLGTTHAFIGGYLVELWGLPRMITEAVTFHHKKSLQGLGGSSPVLEAVWHANRLCHGNYEQSEQFVDFAQSRQDRTENTTGR